MKVEEEIRLLKRVMDYKLAQFEARIIALEEEFSPLREPRGFEGGSMAGWSSATPLVADAPVDEKKELDTNEG